MNEIESTLRTVAGRPEVFGTAACAELLTCADKASATIENKFRKRPVVVTAITFDELVKHGRDSGAPDAQGMPWSFSYKGHPISHERDDCYLIPTLEGTHNMTPADMLITGVKGEIYPCKLDIFAATYEPA